jgi:hypothetical protein
VVGFEVVAKEGELEASLALERTVAGATVAAQASHQRDDMPAEVRDIGGQLGISLCIPRVDPRKGSVVGENTRAEGKACGEQDSGPDGMTQERRRTTSQCTHEKSPSQINATSA